MVKKTRKLDHCILALGEATGHKHEVFGDGVALYESDRNGILLLEAPQGGEIRHEEHHAQAVQFHGLNERLLVQEYDHFLEEARNVAD